MSKFLLNRTVNELENTIFRKLHRLEKSMAPSTQKSGPGAWQYKTSARWSLLRENIKNSVFHEKMSIPHIPNIQLRDPLMQLLENSINHASNIHTQAIRLHSDNFNSNIGTKHYNHIQIRFSKAFLEPL